ncbi:MAG: hypothetical protein DRJ40_07825 [Thermoprotei archaeon]|nr:MAG: hypothetical protein DRJ40_07825 [Thermoprotei archaeon]
MRITIGYEIQGNVAVREAMLDLRGGDVIGIFGKCGSTTVKQLITSLSDLSEEITSTVILDSEGTLRNLKALNEYRYTVLGWNASLPLIEVIPPGKDLSSRLLMVTDIIAAALNLSDIEAHILHNALMKYLTSSSHELDNLMKALSEEYMKLSPVERTRAYNILSLMRDLKYGRLGATFSELHHTVNLEESMLYVDTALIPPSYRPLILSLLMYYLYSRGARGKIIVILNFGTYLSDVSMRSKSFSTLLTTLLINNVTVIHSNSILELPTYLREYITYIIQHRVNTSTEARALADFYKLPEETLTKLRDHEAYLVGRGLCLKIALWHDIVEELPTSRLPRELLTPREPAAQPLIREVFGDRAELVYEVLNYLRRGAVTRDELLSFLTEGMGLDTTSAAKLINELCVHGLVEDFIARDGRYWIRLSIRGLVSVDEYEEWRARET